MPNPHNHSHTNVLNATDTTLPMEDSLSESFDAELFTKRLNRRHSLLSSNEDSYKRLPLGDADSSYKRLPDGSNELNRKTHGSRLKEESTHAASDSFKRLPSISRRNSVLNNSDDGGTPELKRQPSISGKMAEDRRPSLAMLRRTSTVKDFANTSGGDLLRQSSITHRNSLAGDDSRPSLARRSSLVAGFMKAMRWTEESEADKERKNVKTWDDFALLYKKGAPIGRGRQGAVIRGTRLSDQLPVVIKFIDEIALRTWNTINKIPMSAYLLRHLNYPEEHREDPLFCRYLDHFHIEKTWVLVTEYEQHEWIDLYDYVRQRKTPVSEREGIIIFHRLAQAVCRLHSAGFVHSDIKENNVLIHRDTLDIKLIDLCACREIPKEPLSPTEFAGTLAYAAPEVKTGNYFSPESQDIYALGILMLLVFTGGKLPSSVNLEKDEIDPHQISKWIKEREDLDISSVTIKFLQGLLSRKETKRPGILDVIDFCESALEWA